MTDKLITNGINLNIKKFNEPTSTGSTRFGRKCKTMMEVT